MTAEEQLDAFLAKFAPPIIALAKEVRARMRARLPNAVELVYDNYNALVIGYGPTEKPSEAVFSIAMYPKWINLFFLHGAELPDPKRLLQGEGRGVRHIRLTSAADLDAAPVKKLMAEALKRAKPMEGPARLVIRSISAKQRPRR